MTRYNRDVAPPCLAGTIAALQAHHTRALNVLKGLTPAGEQYREECRIKAAMYARQIATLQRIQSGEIRVPQQEAE